MSTALTSVVFQALLVVAVVGNVFLHSPRGSNNRLSESNRYLQNNRRLFNSQNGNQGGYNAGYMSFYSESLLELQWSTSQGCGAPDNGITCQLILQYMCDTLGGAGIRDGATTSTVMISAGDDFATGRHESAGFYMDCQARDRNARLFTADQPLDGNTAVYTRQNTNGERFGFECPEERDYYPYWHPSPWRDIAVITDDTTRCAYYQAESQNVKAKNFCSNAPQFNTEASCTAGGGTWSSEPAFGLPAPVCLDAAIVSPQPTLDMPKINAWTWQLPTVAVESTCVLRIRYNISSSAYDGWVTDSTSNGVASPLSNDPTWDLATGTAATADPSVKLKLDINTDEIGRTFSDRSCTFVIRPRLTDVTATIVNLNVRGARGNHVENFPNVEYAFVPTIVQATTDTAIHRQVTGSNTAPDGAGQGRSGTDRTNFVELDAANRNFFPTFGSGRMISNTTILIDQAAQKVTTATSPEARQLFLTLATVAPNSGALLDDAPTHADFGLMRYDNTGTIAYMNSRSNNFSNRLHKGIINITQGSGSGLLGASDPRLARSQPRTPSAKKQSLSTGAAVAIAVVITAVVMGAAALAVGYLLFRRLQGSGRLQTSKSSNTVSSNTETADSCS